jgi:uncharacterized protein (TIGR02145 family)
MFSGFISLKNPFNQNISNWDVSSVTNMSGMFSYSKFNQPINTWCVTQIQSEPGGFSNNSPLTPANKPIWGTCPQVDRNGEIFSLKSGKVICSGAENGTYGIIGDIMYTAVNNSQLRTMIESGENLSSVCTSNVTNMSNLFDNVTELDSDISQWDVSKVTNMSDMFRDSNINPNIDSWDVFKVNNMYRMFSGASNFNRDISRWSVFNVTNMNKMFRDATNFNQDLSGWCVQNLDEMPSDFDSNATSWSHTRPIWGTCPSTNENNNTVRDIEGKIYSTVQIGNQRWMAQNLRTSRFNDGTSIPEITLEEPVAWSTNSTGSWSFYNDDSENNSPYGKLYNYFVVSSNKNVCPTGWSVPSDSDWGEIHDFLGDNAGRKLKSTYLWHEDGNGTNESGFDAFGAGRKGSSGTSYSDLNKVARFWSSTEYNDNNTFIYRLTHDSDELQRDFNSKNNAFSIRCISNTRPVSIEESKLDIPTSIELHQNYPNPFNPSTQIRFALPESQQVSISVYDVNGKLISKLVSNQTYSAGRHQIIFDGSNLASGIYIYSLRLNNGKFFNNKMVIIK